MLDETAQNAAAKEEGENPAIDQPDPGTFPSLPLGATKVRGLIVMQRELGALELVQQRLATAFRAGIAHSVGMNSMSTALDECCKCGPKQLAGTAIE